MRTFEKETKPNHRGHVPELQVQPRQRDLRSHPSGRHHGGRRCFCEEAILLRQRAGDVQRCKTVWKYGHARGYYACYRQSWLYGYDRYQLRKYIKQTIMWRINFKCDFSLTYQSIFTLPPIVPSASKHVWCIMQSLLITVSLPVLDYWQIIMCAQSMSKWKLTRSHEHKYSISNDYRIRSIVIRCTRTWKNIPESTQIVLDAGSLTMPVFISVLRILNHWIICNARIVTICKLWPRRTMQ